MRSLIFFLLLTGLCSAQVEYPKDYFREPLDIPLVLSGTFAELRSNHFHSGLDIKTQQRTGLNVYATADGYVSRIKISHYGYGKAIYITHPNGYVTVYAHLKKFDDAIERYIKECQYQKESYEVEVFPDPSELPVSKGEIIAFSGNSGGSGGPHLHFEIRDNAERPINPMLFGIDIKDTKAPFISAVYAYPKTDASHVNDSYSRKELRLIPNKNGDYSVEPIKAFGEIGFGIVSYDQQDMAPNKNGLSNIQSFFNGNKNFELDFKRFSFSETKHINRLIDYEVYKSKRSRIQKLFVQNGNSLSLYKDINADGYLKIEDSTSSVYKVRLRDFKGNESWLTIPILGKYKAPKPIQTELSSQYFIHADQVASLKDQDVSVYIPNGTFYDDFHIDFSVRSDTLTLHRDEIPLQKSLTITYDISSYEGEDKSKLYIARLFGYKRTPSYVYTTKKGDLISARTKLLGTFTLEADLEKPIIKPINFQNRKWVSKLTKLKVKIEDEDSGISNYRATINGKWILMEYDYKTDLLVYDFEDNVIQDSENNLKIIVTDNVGNSSTFEATFYKK
ncbi:M23 family metallopeptidase [Ichthyenterobacterium sp. W332]|uniref:M23 family metallopeptidase n=1 Tax=Microcosmobacter mediterraneus TaxID=3075607 RepID=A0ABU2YHB7_9FLAO|nr:M23 family metallopeptidase [Ichthyenterobacterium sp. W332]MDT0557442.1 M23 family metallopeptidase [Ichthyenterobacterium sp. W332]